MDLKDHEIMIPLTNINKSVHQYKCNRCGKGFTTSGNLKRHILNIHMEDKSGTSEIKFCQYCHKTYSRQDYLTQHIKSVHEKANKYQCEQCGKTFTQKGSLTRHVTSVHQNIREFCCKHCNYQAISYNDLKKHAANAHFNRARYECSICGHGSWCASIIKQHIISLHTVNAKTQSRKCKFCGVVINLSKESYPLHVAACKTMSNNDDSGKKKRRKTKTSQDSDEKTEFQPKVLNEDIPWEALCNLTEDIPMETPLVRDDTDTSPLPLEETSGGASAGGSAESHGPGNIVDSVIEGYIKVLQDTGNDT